MLSKEEANAAANVERLMADRHLSFRELANLADVNYSTIAAFVAGRHRPRLGFVRALAEALDVSVDDLMKTPKKSSQKAAV